MAGIGNIYSDEILFAAGLRHDRLSDDLSPEEVRRLYRSIVEILQEAIKHRGSSLADEQYRDLFGDMGDFQRLHNVYDREGQACPRCRATDRPGQGRREEQLLLPQLPDLRGSGTPEAGSGGRLRPGPQPPGLCASTKVATGRGIVQG